MRQIPVIFRERWQLYQTEEGKVYAIDLELLKLIDFKEASRWPSCPETGTWEYSSGATAPSTSPLAGSPGPTRRRSCISLASTGENQIDMEDPVANASLFDEDRDEPLVDREE